jgi:hypothetical protein
MSYNRSGGWRLVACLALTLGAGALTPARAEVVSLTVGLDTACPYGVPN